MIWLLLIFLTPAEGQINETRRETSYISVGTAAFTLPVCADNLDIQAFFEAPLEPRNQYTLNVFREIQAYTRIILRFDSEVSLKLLEPTNARISKYPGPSLRSNQFIVTFTEKASYLSIQVFGPASENSIPYILSVILNGVELCIEPKIGYFDYGIEKPEENAANVFDESCGRRKVVHTELIVRGQPTQSGDWPWHAAILRVDRSSFKYICGGTLLSKTLVLTAAHCATIRGRPVVANSLSIVLGKYNLIGGDIAPQEIGVFEVIVHSAFDAKTLNNDIALLKLKTEAIFDDYVQPACLWHTALSTVELFGTVVGWGFDHLDELSSTLQQITVPIVSELTCLKSNPIFFHRKLNTNKFCAGFANGTSVCNGDSGGGLLIFVPDTAGDTDKASGAWYVRGIVSLAPRRTDAAICDPYQYTILTDVEKYRDWVLEYLN